MAKSQLYKMTASIGAFRAASHSSSALAWLSVRGKPSSMKPSSSGTDFIHSPINFSTVRSGTNSPFSRNNFARCPMAEPFSTSRRSK